MSEQQKYWTLLRVRCQPFQTVKTEPFETRILRGNRERGGQQCSFFTIRMVNFFEKFTLRDSDKW